MRQIRTASPHRTRGRTGRRKAARDAGWVLILQVLLLGSMTTMAALAVDVGSFYSRATDLQKAADAAALAAVVWMPDAPTTATTVARDAAQRNGFTHGSNGITVDVATVAGNPRQIRVNIIDASVPTIFGKLVRNSISMQRDATAEYVLAVPLGSPSSTFGNQSIGATAPNLWGAISGPYTSTVNGDPFAPRCAGSSSATSCNSSNPDYRESGYLYAVEVPASGVGRTLTVEIFDAGFYHRSGSAETGDGRNAGSTGPPVQYELFESDVTPLDNTDNASLNGRCTTGPGKLTLAAEASSSTYKNKWTTLCTFTVTRSGVFPLRVRSSNISGMTEVGNGTNQYSLRSSLSGGGDQPRVYGIGDMSIFTNASGTSTFYLGDVSPIHAGKTFQIDLFDPGDGGSGNYFVEILQPGDTMATCKYTDASGVWGSSGSCRIQTRNSSGNVYNGKWVNIRVELGSTYTCTDCWWKVRYDFGGATPNDRTTWRASILGDPVHLVE
jgi:hypothetical protein